VPELLVTVGEVNTLVKIATGAVAALLLTVLPATTQASSFSAHAARAESLWSSRTGHATAVTASLSPCSTPG
jgi:hypothetical protein